MSLFRGRREGAAGAPNPAPQGPTGAAPAGPGDGAGVPSVDPGAPVAGGPADVRPDTAGAAASSVPAPRPSPAEQRRWRELQRLRGLNAGAAVFGWLVSVGISVLLTALIAAGGTAVGLQRQAVADVSGSTATLTLGGGVLLFLVLVLAYYAGGYVAGRLSRFSGALQGFAVWVLGAVVTAVLAIAGVIAGSQYNVLGQLRLPSIPVKGQTLVDGGVIALALIGLATLVAATLGGAVGRRYHSRVDRALEAVPPGVRV